MCVCVCHYILQNQWLDLIQLTLRESKSVRKVKSVFFFNIRKHLKCYQRHLLLKVMSVTNGKILVPDHFQTITPTLDFVLQIAISV